MFFVFKARPFIIINKNYLAIKRPSFLVHSPAYMIGEINPSMIMELNKSLSKNNLIFRGQLRRQPRASLRPRQNDLDRK
jgi:hypothetical protein